MRLKEVVHYKREGYIVLLTVLIWSIISAVNRNFASMEFLVELFGNNSVYFICALGVLPLMIMRGIDLSVGGMMMMTSVILSFLLSYIQLPIFALLVIGALAGTLFGYLNGQFITRMKVSSIIVTLAMLSIYRGVSRFWFRMNPSAGNELVNYGAQGVFISAKMQNLMILMVVLVTIYILNYSKLGRKIYAVGGNPVIARRKGLNEYKTLIFAYSYSGLCAGMAAFMQMTLLGQTNAQAYSNIEFELIVIVIIGGLNIMGGYGTVIGTFLQLRL